MEFLAFITVCCTFLGDFLHFFNCFELGTQFCVSWHSLSNFCKKSFVCSYYLHLLVGSWSLQGIAYICVWLESSFDPPEGDPGQLAYTFLIRILSTSFISVSIFSVCCYSSPLPSGTLSAFFLTAVWPIQHTKEGDISREKTILMT